MSTENVRTYNKCSGNSTAHFNITFDCALGWSLFDCALGWFFLFFVSRVRPPPRFFLLQFNTQISKISSVFCCKIRGRYGVAGRLKSKFWSILAVFVTLFSLLSYLFIWWKLNVHWVHFGLLTILLFRLVCPRWPLLLFFRFPLAMHNCTVERPAAVSTQNCLFVVTVADHDNVSPWTVHIKNHISGLVSLKPCHVFDVPRQLL